MEVKSHKTKTERFIPVNVEVVQAINKLSEVTKKARNILKTEYLFIYEQKMNNVYSHFNQKQARRSINKIVLEIISLMERKSNNS